MTDHADLRAIRDLVSGHPLQDQLISDRASWDRFCTGLDGITDAETPTGRLGALNTVRAELGMEVVDAFVDETPAAISAGLAAVRAELEHRVNSFREAHARPLSDLFHSSVDYQLEKAAAAVHACLPGEPRDRLDYDRSMGIDALRSTVGEVLGELRRRGYDEWICSDARDALYILDRAGALATGGSAEEARDIDLLVRHALPILVQKARQTAAEIDQSTAEREPGWDPPSAPAD